MFRAMLFTQWKWSRAILLPLVIATFAVPVYSVREFSDGSASRWQVSSLLANMQAWGLAYMFSSVLIAIFIASATWSYDVKSRHVYALRLPIPRWHYQLLRYGAGTLLLLIPTAFLWIGGLVATSSSAIPIGLHAYPTALALRFLLASFVAFSAMFAASAIPKRIAIGIGGALGVLMLTDGVLSQFAGNSVIMSRLFEWAIRWPGFLEVFAGRWMLIDV